MIQARVKVQTQEANIRRLEGLKEKFTIRAPFHGYITSKKTEVGQWVSRGDGVVEIVQLDPIELVVNVPQSSITKLQESFDSSRAEQKPMVARVFVESVPQIFEGQVARIVPQAEPISQSFPVKIRLKNPKTRFGYLLKSGMVARANISVSRNDEILMVKKDALVLGGAQTTVFVIAKDGKSIVRRVPVEIGKTSVDEWIQVTGAIAEGDRVVVTGNERLSDGAEVTVIRELPDSFQTEVDKSRPAKSINNDK